MFCIDNTSMQEVNVIGDDGQELEDDRVHHEHAEAERENDDRAEHEREERLQKEVKQGEDERDEHERDPAAVQHKAGTIMFASHNASALPPTIITRRANQCMVLIIASFLVSSRPASWCRPCPPVSGCPSAPGWSARRRRGSRASRWRGGRR